MNFTNVFCEARATVESDTFPQHCDVNDIQNVRGKNQMLHFIHITDTARCKKDTSI